MCCEMQMRTLKQDAPLPPFIGTIFSQHLGKVELLRGTIVRQNFKQVKLNRGSEYSKTF